MELSDLDFLELLKIVIALLVAIISSKWLWEYLKIRFNRSTDDRIFVRNDQQERILKLEALLDRASIEKQELREKVLGLEIAIAELRTEMMFLKNSEKFKCYYQDFVDPQNQNKPTEE